MVLEDFEHVELKRMQYIFIQHAFVQLYTEYILDLIKKSKVDANADLHSCVLVFWK